MKPRNGDTPQKPLNENSFLEHFWKAPKIRPKSGRWQTSPKTSDTSLLNRFPQNRCPTKTWHNVLTDCIFHFSAPSKWINVGSALTIVSGVLFTYTLLFSFNNFKPHHHTGLLFFSLVFSFCGHTSPAASPPWLASCLLCTPRKTVHDVECCCCPPSPPYTAPLPHFLCGIVQKMTFVIVLVGIQG